MYFNWLDGIITIVLVINFINGLRRGLVRTLFGTLGLIIAGFLCIKGTPTVAELLLNLHISGTFAYITALILLFIFTYLLVNEIGRHIKSVVKESDFRLVDKVGGSLLGFIKGIIYILLIIIPLLGNMIHSSPALLKSIRESGLINFGYPLVYYSEPLIQELFYQGNQTWQEYRKEFDRYNTAVDPVRETEEPTQIKETLQNLDNIKTIIYY